MAAISSVRMAIVDRIIRRCCRSGLPLCALVLGHCLIDSLTQRLGVVIGGRPPPPPREGAPTQTTLKSLDRVLQARYTIETYIIKLVIVGFRKTARGCGWA